MMSIKRKKNVSGKRGFTLLETLVAISILVFAITATFTAAQSSLSVSIDSRDRITAYYLAQEAVELVRNVRDENSLYNYQNPSTPRHWLFGLSEAQSDPCYSGSLGAKKCFVDALTKVFDDCDTPTTCPKLRQDTNTASVTYGLYGHSNSSWPESMYKREIAFTEISSTEILLTVTMTWNKGPLTRTFQAKETLRNWQ